MEELINLGIDPKRVDIQIIENQLIEDQIYDGVNPDDIRLPVDQEELFELYAYKVQCDYIQIPTEFYYSPDASPLLMSSDQFSLLTPFKDDNPEEFLWDNFRIYDIVSYQSYGLLQEYARKYNLPNNGRRILIYYISQEPTSKLINFFSDKHLYPGRKELLSATHSYIDLPLIEDRVGYLLCFPPSHFEKEYLELLLKNGTIRDLRNRFGPYLDHEIDSLNIFSELYPASLMRNYNFNLREVISILRNKTKDFRELKPSKIRRVTGFIVGPLDYYSLFDLLFNPNFYVFNNCKKTLDIFQEPIESIALFYGTFTHNKCYNFSELEDSFIMNEDHVFFRMPDHPNFEFPITSIYRLKYLLKAYSKDEFYDKLDEALKYRKEITPEFYGDYLLTLSDSDKELAIRFLFNLFYLGMLQRCWIPGDEYPMKTAQTRDCTQEEIELRMTPYLNKMDDLLEDMSDFGRSIMQKIGVINYLGEFFPTYDLLTTFLNSVRTGFICIGYGSSLMIYTAYYYLNYLNVNILGFNLEDFEAESTHR